MEDRTKEAAALARFRAQGAFSERCLDRMPVWADLNAISRIYLDASRQVHVDHIVPLKGELVSGLHVRANLRRVAAAENLSKKNRFTPRWEIFREDLLTPA